MIPVQLVFIPLLLLFAGLFASAEAALFSLTRAQLEMLRESKPGVYRQIRFLVFHPDELLSTLIIGNECLNILTGTLVATVLEYATGSTSLGVVFASILVSSVLLLTCSEILPKILAFRLPILTASVLALPTSLAHTAVTPLRKVFLWLSRSLIARMGIHARPPSAVNEQDFLTLVEIGAESGSLDREEKDMIFNVFRFSDQPVSAVMTPWSRVFTVPETVSADIALAEVGRHQFSRVPIVSPADGRVMGILYVKELLHVLLEHDYSQRAAVWKRAVFPPYIVSTHKKISRLFREFKLKKIHFALVVDEYGRQLGVVTLEDLLNALFRTPQGAAAPPQPERIAR